MSRIKVLHIISSLGRGGKERQLYELLKVLGAQIDLYLLVLHQNLSYPIAGLGIPYYTFSSAQRKQIGTYRAVNDRIYKISPDVIHYWDAVSSCYAFAGRVVSRYVLIDGSIRYAGKLKASLPAKLLKATRFMLADRIVANSMAGLRVEGLAASRKACTIHNGMDISRFDIDPGFSAQAMGLDNNMVKIVMVAGFRPAKDHATLVKAAASLCAQYNKLQFVLIGDGEWKDSVQHMIPVEISDKVLFLGNREDVEQILLRCDIGVLLNNTRGHAEGLSNSIMEYMAAGLPVVATNAGGTPELVVDGVTGYLVNSFNTDELIQRLKTLINSIDLRNRFGRAGRQRIELDFSLDLMAKKYLALYQELAGSCK